MSKLKTDEDGKLRPKAARSKKEKAPEFVSCPGYVDEFGIWNNGFQCPKWGGVGDEYCCGSSNKPYCCPEPVETATRGPETNLVPIIAGVVAGVVLMVVLIAVTILSCCFCRCCLINRTCRNRKHKKDSGGVVHSQVCEHCHATLSSTSPDSLACGCPVGAPPGTHIHQLDDVQIDVDRVLTLYENPTANWHNGEMDEMNKEMPFDEPPPYSENALVGSKDNESGDVSLSPTSEDTPMIHRLPGPDTLCMRTFRPLSHRALSPILRMGGGEAMMDSSRRDSGVLVEEQDNNRQYMETEEGEEQDQYNESIVVPTFNFQSLNLVQKSGNGGGLASAALRGSTSSGGLSSSRNSGISHSRSRMRSRSSAESLELTQLDQLMDTIHPGIPTHHGSPSYTGGHGHISGKQGHLPIKEQQYISGEQHKQIIKGNVTGQPYCTGKDAAHLAQYTGNMRIPPV